MTSAQSSPMSSFEPGADVGEAKWVPNEEVTECICGRKFSLYVRKHHCRSCGRIVCGKCSDNQVPIKGKLERVCNACADTLQYDRSGEIAQKRSTTAQREAALKADLKRTLEEGEWCRGFFLNLSMNVGRKGGSTASPDRSVCGSTAGGGEGGGTPFCTPPNTPGGLNDIGAQLEQERLISQGKQRWEDLRFDLRSGMDAVSRLSGEVNELQRELRDRNEQLKKSAAELRTMEDVLSREGDKQEELNDLRRRTADQETKLEGLRQRMQASESGRSAPSSPNVSFRNMSMSGGSLDAPQRCSDRCRQRCSMQ